MKPCLPFLKNTLFFSFFILLSCIGPKSFSQCVVATYPAPAEVLANVPEAVGYNLVYDLPIPTANQSWTLPSDIPYTVNNAAALASGSFSRVAYYLKLESELLGVQWVWVSMDAFTNDLAQISIPVGNIFFQRQVTNMNVRNYAGVNRTAVSGNLESWSNCYNTGNSSSVPNGSNDLYDLGDARDTTADCFYGSFQVHDFDANETLFAYNAWASPLNTADDVGIGNFIYGSGSDWTFANNANFYDVKELYVFVNSPAYQPACKSATVFLNTNGSASLTIPEVTTETIGNCGVQNISLSKTNFTCANLGVNTVAVSFIVNGITSSCSAVVTVKDTIRPVITTTGSAATTLGCNPAAAVIEAAFGGVTATDNCITTNITVTTTPVAANGNTRSQTRTWVVTDGSNNSAKYSSVVSWSTNCNLPEQHIYPASVTCDNFSDGAQPLLNTCYKAVNKRVKKVSPSSFYYYTTVTAPANLGFLNILGILGIDVIQTKNCAGFNLYEIVNNQVRVYDNQCRLVAVGKEQGEGQAKVWILGATPGKKYTVAVKYDTKSLEGSSYTGNTAPVCSNNFVTKTSLGLLGLNSAVVAGSQATLTARPDCYEDNSANSRSFSPEETFTETPELLPTQGFHVLVGQNPSTTNFSLTFKSDSNEPFTIKVTDMSGKLVYSSNKLLAKNTLQIGDQWFAGLYFVEVQQGRERKVIRLVKL